MKAVWKFCLASSSRRGIPCTRASSSVSAFAQRERQRLRCVGTEHDPVGTEPMAASLWRVATYNVLSSELCEPWHFVASDPRDLDPLVRIGRVKAKIEEEIKQKSIVCLQEVSHEWYGELFQQLTESKYAYVHDSYGWKGNGFMGVGIAFPTEKYSLLESKVTRIADTKRGGYQDPNSANPAAAGKGFFGKLRAILRQFVKSIIKLFVGAKPNQTEALWKSVERRMNTMVFVRLEDKSTKHRLCVATYHMPCAWKTPPVISVHSSLLAQKASKLAGDSDSLIVAGDMNFQPDSPMYELLTEGKFLSEESEKEGSMPLAYPSDPFKLTLANSLKSAYKEFNSEEPHFTNLAKTAGMQERFISVLDYIFFQQKGSWKLKVTGVDELPTLDEVKDIKSLPSATEPSDHIKIAANFSVTSD